MLTFAQQQALLDQGGNMSTLYSLSVVQLSHTEHADMLALFATVQGKVQCLLVASPCRTPPNRITPL